MRLLLAAATRMEFPKEVTLSRSCTLVSQSGRQSLSQSLSQSISESVSQSESQSISCLRQSAGNLLQLSIVCRLAKTKP